MSMDSTFKTPEGAELYRAAYNAMLARWPVPSQSLDVTTSFGVIHLNVAGDSALPPLFLIHGFAVSSTQWYPNVGPLSRHFRVYALDVINQMGLSVSTRQIKTRQDCANWLIELLDALKIDHSTFVGHSYGGWLSTNLALIAPQRVDHLVLLSPASVFTSLAMPFMLSFLSAFFIPTRPMIYRFMQQTTTTRLARGELFVEQLVMGIKHLKPQQMAGPVLTVFKDDELRQIKIPTLLLIGAREVAFNVDRTIARARRVIPHIEVELIPGGGHLFPTDQSDATNERILKFLKSG
ncbi:MAG: alpha/beta hydrolase [Anaerolineae bacterium]|nr:alpha/beta hydrolase [Anaerolineae bacterium]